VTTQAELDVWSSRLHELKIEEQGREIAELRALLVGSMNFTSEYGPSYDAWWDKADAALKRTESYGWPT